MSRIIARTHEIETLERKYRSGKSELVIVYGRRRIGKTFLVNNVFADRFTFSFVGARRQKQEKQLARFAMQLKLFSDSPYAPALNNWEEAFNELRTLIERKPRNKRKVIFFDEMPWIDTPKVLLWKHWSISGTHGQRSEMTSCLLPAVRQLLGWSTNLLRTRVACITASQSRYTYGHSVWVSVKNICMTMGACGTDTQFFSAIWLWGGCLIT